MKHHPMFSPFLSLALVAAAGIAHGGEPLPSPGTAPGPRPEWLTLIDPLTRGLSAPLPRYSAELGGPWSAQSSSFLFAQAQAHDLTPLDDGFGDASQVNVAGGVGFDQGAGQLLIPVYHQETLARDERYRRFDAVGLEWVQRLQGDQRLSLRAQYGGYAYLDQARRNTASTAAAVAWSNEFDLVGRARVSGGLFLGDEAARDKSYRYVGRRYYGLTLDGSLRLFQDHTPFVSLTRQWSDYSGEDPTYALVRREEYSRLSAGWAWQVMPGWGLRAEAAYSLNDSNLESYQYDRSRLLFSTRFDFR